jgi:hypothetical protein
MSGREVKDAYMGDALAFFHAAALLARKQDLRGCVQRPQEPDDGLGKEKGSGGKIREEPSQVVIRIKFSRKGYEQYVSRGS